MSITRATFVSVSGNLHCVFFMGMVGTAFDYPSKVYDNFGRWRETPPATVKCEIAFSSGVEALS